MGESVVSVGSIWLLDEAGGRYMRMPNTEAPRERPEWGDERAGACQDGVWHGLDAWWRCDNGRRMVIAPTGESPFWVPLVDEVLDTTFDVWAEVAEHARRERPES
jgi:hypothetical protein